MKRIVLALALTGMLVAAAHAETPATYLGFQTGITKAPRHAAFFRDSPHCGLVKHTRIFYVDGKNFEHDAFSYESVWYVYCNSYWYRARTFHGPFAAIDVRQVPRPILEVKGIYWKRHPLGPLAGATKEDLKEIRAKREKREKKSVSTAKHTGSIKPAAKKKSGVKQDKPRDPKSEKSKLAGSATSGSNLKSGDRKRERQSSAQDGVIARNQAGRH